MQRGYMLVEAIVAAAIFAAVVAGTIGAFSTTLRSALGNSAALQAAFLDDEGLEAMRTLRDSSWSANIAPLSTSTPLYLSFSTTTSVWSATTTDIMIGAFDRTILLTDVYRDASQNTTALGGTYDPNTKLVTVTVSWMSGTATTSRSLSTYITNVYSN